MGEILSSYLFEKFLVNFKQNNRLVIKNIAMKMIRSSEMECIKGMQPIAQSKQSHSGHTNSNRFKE